MFLASQEGMQNIFCHENNAKSSDHTIPLFIQLYESFYYRVTLWAIKLNNSVKLGLHWYFGCCGGYCDMPSRYPFKNQGLQE